MVSLQDIAGQIKNKGKYWLAFTGDSITSCEWVHPNWREIVEYVLKEELTKIQGDWKNSSWGIRTFNLAYDGATTADILEKVNYINSISPDLVIGLMGTNDPLFKLSVSEHINNTKKVIESIKSRIVWCTSTPAIAGSAENDEYRPYAESVMRLPQSDDLQLIDMFSIYQQFPLEKFFTFFEGDEPDILHPNQLGNAYIAKIILKEVFGIEFDPEKFMQTTLAGEKYPSY